MEELLGWVKQGFWTFTGLNFKWKHEHKPWEHHFARKEQWRRGKQSEENRGQQLQSYFTLLEHFPISIFYMLYTISKLRKSRIQDFKPCMIWSWNEEDKAFGRQLHHVKWPISQGEFHLLQGDFPHGPKYGHFAPWRNHPAKFRKVDLGTLWNAKFSQGGFSPCEIWTLHLFIPLPVLQDILLDF